MPYPPRAGLYTCSMAGSVFYELGRIAGVQVRKARWMWESVSGNEAEDIQAEHAVGRDMAAVVLEDTPRDSDRTTQALLDEIGGKLAAVVRNRLHRFQMTAIETDRPTAFALPGGFIFVARSLVELCHRNKDDIAFVLAHEMAHVIRRHAIERLLKARKVVVASGAWSRVLTAPLGDLIPLDTERGYNTTLPPGSFDLRRQLVFGGHGFVVTPLSTGVRVGGAVELGGLKLPPNFARADAMLTKAGKLMPGLKTTGGKQWMGFRPSLPDSLPAIGRSRPSPHIIYAFGHGHLGLTQSAGTGKLVAELITGATPSLDLSPFSPQRF